MRVIELATEPLNEREFLQDTMRSAPQRGYTVDELRQGVKVLERFETDGLLRLEEAEWSFVCSRLRAAQWLRVDKNLLAMIDKVLDAKEVNP